MLIDIVEVKFIRNYLLYLRFENGVEGEVDISQIIPFTGVFSKLRNPNYFSTVHVSKDLGTIVWDNGADLSPSYLYSIITSKAA
jgi:uncharacterized protein DUF2442